MELHALHSQKVFLVDDHEIVRRGFQDLLQNKRDISVVGACASASEAIDRILALRPDVMIVDLHLHHESGVTVCREVRSADPAIKGMLLTAADDDEALLSAVIAGAHGYVLKDARALSLVDAIRCLGQGRPLLDVGARRRFMERLAALRDTSGGLTPGERETLGYVMDGLAGAGYGDPARVSAPSTERQVASLIPKLAYLLSGRDRRAEGRGQVHGTG